MTTSRLFAKKRIFLALCAAGLLSASFAAQSEEREDLERLRATVLGLMETLVKNGVLPRAKVDAMMREAEATATERLARMPAPEIGADGKKIVRVQFVPESIKTQMREQVKAEVSAQTGAGRIVSASGGDNGARIRFEGDVRVRAELDRFSSDNTPVSAYSSAALATRAADFMVLGGPGKDLHTANTLTNTDRERVRARAGIEADLSESVTASFALATGTTASPTSTNQTMSSSGFFNKYSVVVDRAAIRVQPFSWLSLNGGRFRNPFVGTDLVWADDLNFEGVSLTLKPQLTPVMGTFLTAGWFPLSPSVPNQSRSRSLLGVQAGLDWQIGQKENRLKVSSALYEYRGIEGIAETQATYQSVPDYVVRSEYGSSYRQRGNTLFRINAPSSIDPATNWGLASGFREWDITASLDVAQFDPLHVILTGDLVKNLKFDRSEMQKRTGMSIADGKSIGYLVKAQVGAVSTMKAGAWNGYLGYRYVGSDAVVDAFTNSDFGLGGTNSKGLIFGANYGLAKNTWLSARWLSADLIEAVVPTTTTAAAKPSKFSTDVIQVDLNVKF